MRSCVSWERKREKDKGFFQISKRQALEQRGVQKGNDAWTSTSEGKKMVKCTTSEAKSYTHFLHPLQFIDQGDCRKHHSSTRCRMFFSLPAKKFLIFSVRNVLCKCNYIRRQQRIKLGGLKRRGCPTPFHYYEL